MEVSNSLKNNFFFILFNSSVQIQGKESVETIDETTFASTSHLENFASTYLKLLSVLRQQKQR